MASPDNMVQKDTEADCMARVAAGAEQTPASCAAARADEAFPQVVARPDGPEEECAVFGVYAPDDDVARMACYGLQNLQHRGQESCGIAVAHDGVFSAFKGPGLVASVFTDDMFAGLQGTLAVGHCRYSTSKGGPGAALTQPFVEAWEHGSFALAHNGTLINNDELRAELADRGVDTTGKNDSGMAAQLLACFLNDGLDEVSAIQRLMSRMKGSYSMVVGTQDALFAFRDPSGIRPLDAGELPAGRGWVVASETCGLDIVGAVPVCEVGPGEILRFDASGMQKFTGVPAGTPALCIFEYVYFARPDSVIAGRTVYETRRRMGRELALEAPVDADVVLGVPDSGVPPAIAYAQTAELPYIDGIVKNRYVGRTFIQPTQSLRQLGLRLKLNPLKSVIAGKRLVVVDDSIVRGNTAKALVAMLRDAGAREVHLRIVSPETRWPCFFGMDTATQEELLCAKMTDDEACAWVGADSLKYLSIQGLRKAVLEAGGEEVRADGTTAAGHDIVTTCGLCDACFTGNYPFDLPESLKQTGFLPENR